MIPKVIHYCWFGNGEKPELVLSCIDSWKKKLPDYDIIEWNENNFDVNFCLYSKQAYELKKFAFVSDVARFQILNEKGGIYLDTDVEVIRSLDDFLSNELFFGYDQRSKVASGLIMGSSASNSILKEILHYYSTTPFLLKNGFPNTTTVVTIVSDILEKNDFTLNGEFVSKQGVTIYPWDYFDPYDYENKKMIKTNNTHAIHYYAGSWKSPNDEKIYRIGRFIKRITGERIYSKIARLKHKIMG